MDAASDSAAQLARVSLSYSDAETLCAGHITLPDPSGMAPTCVPLFSSPLDASSSNTDGSPHRAVLSSEAAIRGTVKQLAYGEDGFLLPSAVTHTFELTPAAPDHTIDLRAAIHLARQQFVCALAAYLSLQEDAAEPLEDPMHEEGSTIRALLTQPRAGQDGWPGWFRVATLMAEDCAAWLRHAASTLDGLSFETSGEKAAVLGALVCMHATARVLLPSAAARQLLT